MKHPFSTKILPYFTLIAGVTGFRLRALLFSAMDEKHLLPANHPADSCLFLLTAIVLGVLFLSTRKLTVRPISHKRLRSFELFAAFCYALGGLGLIAAGLAGYSTKLALPATLASLAGGLDLIVMAFLKLLGKKLPYGLPAVLTVVLMLSTVAQCQSWGTIPQLSVYFFPMMASIFLILTAYQKTAVTAGSGNPTHLAFFSQGALFFCFIALSTEQWPLYLGMLFWAAAQLYPCIYTLKEA
jgi:hypothetical protein